MNKIIIGAIGIVAILLAVSIAGAYTISTTTNDLKIQYILEFEPSNIPTHRLTIHEAKFLDTYWWDDIFQIFEYVMGDLVEDETLISTVLYLKVDVQPDWCDSGVITDDGQMYAQVHNESINWWVRTWAWRGTIGKFSSTEPWTEQFEVTIENIPEDLVMVGSEIGLRTSVGVYRAEGTTWSFTNEMYDATVV